MAEKPNNRGEIIDRWNRYAGVPVGSYYCASAVSWANHVGGAVRPNIRSASARRHFVRGYSFTMNDIMLGRYTPKAGDDLVWGRKGGGHIGKITSYLGNGMFRTVEANTSNGKGGSQHNGGGVYERTRIYQAWNKSFYMIGVTPVR